MYEGRDIPGEVNLLRSNSFQWQAPAVWGCGQRAHIPVSADGASESRAVELEDDRFAV